MNIDNRVLVGFQYNYRTYNDLEHVLIPDTIDLELLEGFAHDYHNLIHASYNLMEASYYTGETMFSPAVPLNFITSIQILLYNFGISDFEFIEDPITIPKKVERFYIYI